MNRLRRWLLKLVLFEIGVIKTDPGDMVVLQTPDYLTMAHLEEIQSELQKAFPGNKTLICYGGADIQVFKGTGSDGVTLEEGTYSIDYIDHRTVRLRKVAI